MNESLFQECDILYQEHKALERKLTNSYERVVGALLERGGCLALDARHYHFHWFADSDSAFEWSKAQANHYMILGIYNLLNHTEFVDLVCDKMRLYHLLSVTGYWILESDRS